MPFSKLSLSLAVVEGVKARGYIEPTPNQLRAIPLILAGHDGIGSAQTGTGKTGAFVCGSVFFLKLVFLKIKLSRDLIDQ
ncbi:MAG TPA: DEAD/DEAH box helicase [Candidatus Angelobacter sp.]|nr:DEAD/DEAH box helicase [Candidatus Angelobacter sp.]